MISSDHSPTRFDDPHGKKVAGEDASFEKIPNGIPGIGARMRLMYSLGVAAGRISLEEFVSLTSTRPAKLFGLFPRKGSIAIGSDADFVLWDGNARTTLHKEDLLDHSDFTPYEGMELTGVPVSTWSRGRCVIDHGRVVGKAGDGAFLARGDYPLVDPKGRSVLDAARRLTSPLDASR